MHYDGIYIFLPSILISAEDFIVINYETRTYSLQRTNTLCILDFSIRCFDHFPVVTCPAEGQIFISGCVPTATCEDLNATAICASTGGACGCPDGKVLSKKLNTCVHLSECH